MSSRSSVDWAPARCLGGYGFDSCRGLRFFLCSMLMSWSSIHLSHDQIIFTKEFLLKIFDISVLTRFFIFFPQALLPVSSMSHGFLIRILKVNGMIHDIQTENGYISRLESTDQFFSYFSTGCVSISCHRLFNVSFSCHSTSPSRLTLFSPYSVLVPATTWICLGPRIFLSSCSTCANVFLDNNWIKATRKYLILTA